MLGLRSLVQNETGSAWIYRLDPRTKLTALTAMAVAVVCLDEPRHLLFLLLLTFLGYANARFSSGKYKLTLIILLIGLWGVTFSQAIFFRQWPRTVIVTLVPARFPILGELTGGIFIYREGFEHGLAQGLRLAAMTSSGLLTAWTTSPRDLLLGLAGLKMPAGLSFMLTTAVRFLPLLLSEIGTVVAVQRLRGVNPLRVGRNSIANMLNLLTPVLANAVKRAATLGASCESRAFDPLYQRTSLRDLQFSRMDQCLTGALVVSSSLLFLIKFTFWLYQADLVYISQLRWLYQLARTL